MILSKSDIFQNATLLEKVQFFIKRLPPVFSTVCLTALLALPNGEGLSDCARNQSLSRQYFIIDFELPIFGLDLGFLPDKRMRFSKCMVTYS